VTGAKAQDTSASFSQDAQVTVSHTSKWRFRQTERGTKQFKPSSDCQEYLVAGMFAVHNCVAITGDALPVIKIKLETQIKIFAPSKQAYAEDIC
jgi:hypothetical protein